MFIEFIKRYGLGMTIAVACLIALVYNNLTEPEYFGGEALMWTIVGYIASIGSVVGMIVHAVLWYRAVKKANSK